MQMVADEMMLASSSHQERGDHDPWRTLKTTLIFLPSSRVLFDWLALFGIALTVLLVPFSVAFDVRWEKLGVVHLALGATNLVDIFVNFRTVRALERK